MVSLKLTSINIPAHKQPSIHKCLLGAFPACALWSLPKGRFKYSNTHNYLVLKLLATGLDGGVNIKDVESPQQYQVVKFQQRRKTMAA